MLLLLSSHSHSSSEAVILLVRSAGASRAQSLSHPPVRSHLNICCRSLAETACNTHRYKPRDVYAVVADIDSYEHFVPYASRSRVLSASTSSSTRQSTSSRRLLSTHELASKPWIPGTGANAASAGGDKWELEAELAVGAMGFDERYKSHVTLVPLHTVTVRAFLSLCDEPWLTIEVLETGHRK